MHSLAISPSLGVSLINRVDVSTNLQTMVELQDHFSAFGLKHIHERGQESEV